MSAPLERVEVGGYPVRDVRFSHGALAAFDPHCWAAREARAKRAEARRRTRILVIALSLLGAAGAFALVYSIAHWPKRTPPLAPGTTLVPPDPDPAARLP